MKQVIVITGASSGFGRLTANALARAPATRSTRRCARPPAATPSRPPTSRNSPRDNEVDLRAHRTRRRFEASADAAVEKIITEQGRIDVVIHNAGHMVFGPAEAFTPEQLAQLYDVNVLRTQRVNRAALPQLRKQGRGFWSGSRAAARPAARRRISRPILRPKPAWMRLPWSTRANCRAGASKPRSSCPVPSPAAPIISRIRASPAD